MNDSETFFLSYSESVVKSIVDICAGIPDLSCSPVLEIALGIEDEIYNRALSTAPGDKELWECDGALAEYKRVSEIVLHKLVESGALNRRISSSRPSYIVDKLCGTQESSQMNCKMPSKVGAAKAKRLQASKKQPYQPKCRKVPEKVSRQIFNKSPTSVAEMTTSKMLVLEKSDSYSCSDMAKNAMLPPPGKPLRIKLVHSHASQEPELKRIKLTCGSDVH